jgi:glycosyltransferase involved in cell wall biosynthesis
VIGCIAHFADHKDHRNLIAAAAQLAAARPDVRFLLVGEGELRPEIELQVNNLRLRDIIILVGFRSDIPQLLAAMDVVVLASHHEGLGTSLLDAMAMARPVVATAVGGIPEIVIEGETGRLVPPRDPVALADALLALVADAALRARLGAAGRKRLLERFSAEAMVERTESVYRALLARRPAAAAGRAG